MALGDSYASVEELEGRLGKADDGSFTSLLHAASRQVEAFTRRQFNRTDELSTRRFRAVDPERLPVDDFHTLDDLVVEVGGVVLDEDTYDARPWNGVVDGLDGWPFFDLFAVGRYWPLGRRATVSVTAQWGWAMVPTGVVEATLSVAKAMADLTGVSGVSGVVRSEMIDGYSVSYAIPELAVMAGTPSALASAAPYRRKRFGVA